MTASIIPTPAAAIKCGKCKAYHPSIAAVRACHIGDTQIIVDRRPAAAVRQTSTTVPASEKQINFINDLAAKLGIAAPVPTDRSNASTIIDDLRGRVNMAPAKVETASAPAKLPEVPAGHYAVEIAGTLGFFQVDRPTEGKWAGFTFLKQQASDDTFPVRNAEKRLAILEAIAENPEAAMLLYGQEIGRCGHCNRTLTNEESRERGIGPICAQKMGW